MKNRAHEFAIARASARNVAVHGAGNGVMFDEVSVGGRFELGKALGCIVRDFARTPSA